MMAAVCKSLDGPGGLTVESVPDPVAQPGQAIIRVTAVGLNFADTLITRGKYQFKPELPFFPGAEIAGVVETCGPGCDLAPGTRVMAYVGWNGAAEQVAVDHRNLIALPDAVSDVVASGLAVTYGTALHGLADRAGLRAGETIVVTGAAGGAGQAAVQVAKSMGARVIAVASSGEKAAVARAAGADDVIPFPGSDLKAAVKNLTGGHGADVVYDCIGGDAAEPLIRSLAWGGRFLVVGFAAGEIPKIPLNLLLLKGSAAIGVFWGEALRRDQARHQLNMARVLSWVARGDLAPAIHGVFPLAEIRSALAILERREAQGKVVLTP